MNDFLKLLNLTSERLGAVVLAANDDFFAEKENLICDAEAIWDADRYTDRGKWMDGWESRRRREPGYDWCVVRLGLPGIVRGVVVDTAHFRGNYPESCSIEACSLPTESSVEDLLNPDVEWLEILPQVTLEGNAKNPFEVDAPFRFTHLRLNIYPDGGVARLRVHGEVVPDSVALAAPDSINLLALELGAQVLGASDRFFSSPENLLRAGDSTGMHDGWETKRRRGPGNDWATFRLAAPGTARQIEVDTTHFKGNAPGSCSVETLSLPKGNNEASVANAPWQTLLAQTDLQADHNHRFDQLETVDHPITHLRLQTYPDGGVARLRLYGQMAESAHPTLALRELNCLPPAQAKLRLLDCCGANAWAEAMALQRPFTDVASLQTAAASAADSLGDDQWLEAFRAHPAIGGSEAEHPRGETAANWSHQEQSGVESAEVGTLKALAATNQRYRERFGFGFIICATGKSAEEILTSLQERLNHDVHQELAIATQEERKILRLRLARLLQTEGR